MINDSRKWDPGALLKVAFLGGTESLRSRTEAAAKEWAKYCNINFDFRENGKFREWSTSDKDYKAQIRIAFDANGYWSAVGRDSVDAGALAGEASMNLEVSPSGVPWDYTTIVKHEFGHALGFEHEHQHPREGCDAEFRWRDEPGYVLTQGDQHQYVPDCNGKHPGLYTVFGGAPNYWCKEKVDFNLGQLPESHAYKLGPFDVKSIMKYYLEEWMFVKGKESRCYSEENLEISDGDKKGAASIYPNSAVEIKRVLDERRRTLDTILRAKGLSPQLEQQYRLERESLPK